MIKLVIVAVLLSGCARGVMMVNPVTLDKKLCSAEWSPMGGAIMQGSAIRSCVKAWESEGYKKK